MRKLNFANASRLSLVGILSIILLSGAAFAATEFKPECGAPGDMLVITGEDFDEEPAVLIDGIDAEVIKSNDEFILVIVPDDATVGSVDVTVDSTLLDDEFIVLAEGSPVVHRVSAETATPGMSILLIGRRLGGGEVRFVDSSGETADTVTAKGRRRALMVTIPDDLEAGTYTLVVENGDELDTGKCSPELTVVAAGDAAITAIDPEEALPGARITIEGTDLSPAGFCRVIWTDSAGEVLKSFGFTNGYDEVRTSVPFKAGAGESYDVSVALRDGKDWTETGTIAYEVGTPEAPAIDELDPDSGPAGSMVRLMGDGLMSFGGMPKVVFKGGTDDYKAKVFGMMPGKGFGFGSMKNGFGGMGGELMVMVPEKLEDGEYDVTVTVGDQTSEAVTFTVQTNDLTVSSMDPTSSGSKGFARPIMIEGTGFGTKNTTEITVTFDDGENEALTGKILWQMDSLLMVALPGTWKDPLPEGTYEVTVTRDPDGDAEEADAGDYTVE